MKVLHVVGGSPTGGAFKGAYILHKALIDRGIKSYILNNHSKEKIEKEQNICFINNTIYTKFLSFIYVYFEKIIKTIFLKSPRSTFTIGIVGFDITKLKLYEEFDIIHIHWLSDGFININSLKKVKKPVVWTMRDMWPFTGGSHYTIDFQEYEKKKISNIIQNFKRKLYGKNFHFIAISDWLKLQAKKSRVLSEFEIKKIYNNVDIDSFKLIDKKIAKNKLQIKTNKKIILFGAQNPQSYRKGWSIFIETLKKLDKSKYFILLFGNFWSQKILKDIGIEYLSLGFINDVKRLNLAYCASDIFTFGSLQEAFGKTCIEALACRLPVVCFNNTSASEFISHKKNGYIVDEISADQLKDGINWIATQFNNKNSFENSNLSINNFKSKKICDEYIEFYNMILK